VPSGIFPQGKRNIFIADKENHRIRVVRVHDGKISTLAGSGAPGFNGDDQPAVMAQLNKPAGVVMATTGGGAKIYISDTLNNRIRVLSFKIARQLY